MRFAFISRYKNYPDGDFPGGDETVHGQIADLLKKNGHEVDYYGFDSVTEAQKLTKFQKVFAFRVFLLAPKLIGQFFSRVQSQYDYVIANGEYGAFIQHSKTIVLYHFSSLGYMKHLFHFRYIIKNLLNPRLYSQLLFFIRKIQLEKKAGKNHYNVAVSDFVKGWLEKENIHIQEVIHNSLDLKKFIPSESLKTGNLLYVGRYDYSGKGLDILEKLAFRGMAIDCYTNRDKGKVNGLNYCGLIQYSEMAHLYVKYKILVFPSRYESGPMVCLEAMASGLPVVMSKVGYGFLLEKEIPEFVVDGWAEKSIDEYELKIKLIMSDYNHYSQLARAFVEKYFHPEVFNKDWQYCFQKLSDSVQNKKN